MVWQDITFSISTILFAYALIPQIYDNWRKQKGSINIQTSLLTTIGMIAVTISFFSLDFFLSTIVAFITSFLWAILFAQKVKYG